MSQIRTFEFQEAAEASRPPPVPPTANAESSSPSPAHAANDHLAVLAPPLRLALSRKGASYILVHPTPQFDSHNERQVLVINALPSADPFPELGEGGRCRIWLKPGAGKSGEPGSETEGLLEKLCAAGVVRDTGTTAQQGMITYPLVEIMIPPHALCNACACCGAFETQKEGDETPKRFLRCARCKQAFYCSALCQGKDWKSSHKPVCLDLPQDDDASIELARRRALMRLFGRTVAARVGPRSKMD